VIHNLDYALVNSIMVSWDHPTILNSTDSEAVTLLGYEVYADDGRQNDPIRWDAEPKCTPQKKSAFKLVGNGTNATLVARPDPLLHSLSPADLLPDPYCLLTHIEIGDGKGSPWYNIKARAVASTGKSEWTYMIARVGNAPQIAHVTPTFEKAAEKTVTFVWTEPPDDRSRAFKYEGELRPVQEIAVQGWDHNSTRCKCRSYHGAPLNDGLCMCLETVPWSPPRNTSPIAPWPPIATIPAQLGVKYQFRVRAGNEIGWGQFSPWSSVAQVYGPPAAPVQVRQDYAFAERRMVHISFLGPIPSSEAAGFSSSVTYEAWTQIDAPGLEDSVCAAARVQRGQTADFVLAATVTFTQYNHSVGNVSNASNASVLRDEAYFHELSMRGRVASRATCADPRLSYFCEPVLFSFQECRGAVLNVKIRSVNPSTQVSEFTPEITYVVAATPSPPLYLKSETVAPRSVQLSWTASADSGDMPLDRYEVRAVPGLDWTPVAATSLSYTYVNLPRERVKLEVRSWNRLGPSTTSVRGHEVT
jgi:hypothetical protein